MIYETGLIDLTGLPLFPHPSKSGTSKPDETS